MGMRSGGLSAFVVLLVVSACGGGRRSVLVPPRLDLQPYGRLGLVTFTVENAKGSLHEFATERVGHVALVGGQLDFSAKDPKEAYGPLVNTLIRLVTQDMRSTWQRQ